MKKDLPWEFIPDEEIKAFEYVEASKIEGPPKEYPQNVLWGINRALKYINQPNHSVQKVAWAVSCLEECARILKRKNMVRFYNPEEREEK